MEKINNESLYINFCNNFKSLLPEKFNNSINVYPTSYGIGVFVLFSYRNENIKIKNEIENILISKGIQYKNEYSEAGWVFRYKISKSIESLSKI